MTPELDKQQRTAAIGSLQRYFDENMPEPLGDLPAGLLLDFFMQEIGGIVYNKAVADAQTRIVQRAGDLHGELFADEFEYWAKRGKRTR